MAQLLAPFAGDRASALAARLIAEFGGLHRALSADAARIADPETAEACRIVQSSATLVSAAVREALHGARVTPDDPQMLAYLRMRIGCADDEQVHAVFLDARARYLRDETVTLGDRRQVSIQSAEVFSRAASLDARGLIIAHNHPSGDCRPSRSDFLTTQKLRDAARQRGIVLLDHLIVTRSACFSMRAGKILHGTQQHD